MIFGIIHPGSGLGNSLHRYVATRVLALDKGYTWGMINPNGFKGKSFLNLDMGVIPEFQCEVEVPEGKIHPITEMKRYEEKKVTENGVDIRGYDPEFNFVEDNTIIDGEFQDIRYFGHREEEIRQWLNPRQVPLEYVDLFSNPNKCVIGFRGGEFASIPDLFLPVSYWQEAINMMKQTNPNMTFEVHTDDSKLAKKIFPECEVIQDMARNWCAIYSAKYLIIANSSFHILPALLNVHAKRIIAPRYWARRNTKTWALPQNYYKKFEYI